MYVVYGTLPCEYWEDMSIQYTGLIVVSSCYTVYENKPSDCEWLIPGTWQEE